MSIGMAAGGRRVCPYEVQNLVAHGSTFNIYLAQDRERAQPVILKVLHAAHALNPDFVEELRNRAGGVAELSHPNIAKIHNVGYTSAGRLYVAMEYAQKGSLAEKMASLKERGRAFSTVRALRLIRQVAMGLAESQRAGFSPCDFKPGHILLRPDYAPVLIGLDTLGQNGFELAESHTSFGTLKYRAPELEKEPPDARSHVYTLGVILCQLLADGPPPGHENGGHNGNRGVRGEVDEALDALRKDVTDETRWIVSICLQAEPVARFQTMEELIAAVDQAIVAELSRGELQVEGGPIKRAVGRRLGRRWWDYLLIALIIGAFALAVVFLQDVSAFPGRTSSASHAPLRFAKEAVDAPAVIAPDTDRTGGIGPATLQLVQPMRNDYLELSESLVFTWSWLEPLSAEQQFVVYLISANREAKIGVSSMPFEDYHYRLQVPAGRLAGLPGDYQWQVRLENTTTGETLTESEIRPVSLLLHGSLTTSIHYQSFIDAPAESLAERGN